MSQMTESFKIALINRVRRMSRNITIHLTNSFSIEYIEE